MFERTAEARSITAGRVLLIRSDGDINAILSPATKCFARIGDGMLCIILMRDNANNWCFRDAIFGGKLCDITRDFREQVVCWDDDAKTRGADGEGFISPPTINVM